jgi:two-component system, OmpR family, response regulator
MGLLLALARSGSMRPIAMLEHRIKALIVDDYDNAANSLRSLLQLIGCYAELCKDPCSCLEHSQRLSPELIFVDLAMSRVDGCDIAHALRQSSLPPFLLVGFVGRRDDATCERCQRTGFDVYLPKSATAQQIRAVVESARQLVRA